MLCGAVGRAEGGVGRGAEGGGQGGGRYGVWGACQCLFRVELGFRSPGFVTLSQCKYFHKAVSWSF